MYTLDKIKETIKPIAEEYGVERIYLFGSYAKGNATEKSDLDFRIDKGQLKGKGLFAFSSFYNRIDAAFNIPVDIVTTNSLKDDFLENIKEGEIIVYEHTE